MIHFVNGWNFFDDLLGTLGKVDLLRRSKSPRIQKIHDELFFGCNLPAMTPPGKSWSPRWTAGEIGKLRSTMRIVWQSIQDNFSLSRRESVQRSTAPRPDPRARRRRT